MQELDNVQSRKVVNIEDIYISKLASERKGGGLIAFCCDIRTSKSVFGR